MLYFAYGSNMSFAQMKERCPGGRFLGPAVNPPATSTWPVSSKFAVAQPRGIQVPRE